MKDNFFIVLLVGICLFFLIPLFHNGIPETHDGEAHVARFAAYFQAFQDGQFPARWAGNLNFGYGSPIFIFYYPLPGYLASTLHFFGVSFENSFKVLLVVSFLAAPVFCYFWMKQLFDKHVAFVGALLYGFAPYHFLNLYVRGDVAELMAFVFLPLVFFFLEQILFLSSRPTVREWRDLRTNDTLLQRFLDFARNDRILAYVFLGGFFYALLVLSHNGVSLMLSPMFLLYILIRSKTKKALLFSGSILAIGLLLSAFFWFPALYEGKYTNAKLFVGDMYKDNFPTFSQLVVSPWSFGADVTKPGGLSPQIGVVALGFVLLSLVLLFLDSRFPSNSAGRRGNDKRVLCFWIFVFLTSVFVTLPISDMFWKTISLSRLYEFPWRFVGLASFVAAVLSCFVLAKIKRPFVLIGIVILLMFVSIPFTKVKNYLSHTDQFYLSYTGTTDFHNVASTIWSAGNPSGPAKQQIDFISGNGKITNLEKLSHRHAFTVETKEASTLVDNTFYFPGWKVSIDEKEVPVQFQDPRYPGLITFEVPQGKHNITVFFTESPIRQISNILSVVSFGFIIVIFLYYGRDKSAKLCYK